MTHGLTNTAATALVVGACAGAPAMAQDELTNTEMNTTQQSEVAQSEMIDMSTPNSAAGSHILQEATLVTYRGEADDDGFFDFLESDEKRVGLALELEEPRDDLSIHVYTFNGEGSPELIMSETDLELLEGATQDNPIWIDYTPDTRQSMKDFLVVASNDGRIEESKILSYNTSERQAQVIH